MKTYQIALSVLFLSVFVGLDRPVAAHEDDLKSPNLQPRIGIMSELVVRQKLATYGLTNVQDLKLIDNRYFMRATYEGKPIDLEMNAQSGFLTEKASSMRLPVAPSVRNRIIDSYQIKLDRQELVKPELIQQIGPLNR